MFNERQNRGRFQHGPQLKLAKGFRQVVGSEPQWTLEHVQQLTPRFFQIAAKNKKTHYVQTFPPSTMSISMSNKCASKHVPSILWWWG